MKIVIVGAGKIGYTIAKKLVNEENDIIIIDNNPQLITNVTEEIDVVGVLGNGASINTLKVASVGQSDLIIATTSNDEINMLCSFLAKKLGAKNCIARIRNPEYNEEIDWLQTEMGINLVINPELEAAKEIVRLLRYPNTTHVDSFVNSSVELVGVRIKEENKIANKKVSDLFYNKETKVLIAIIERKEKVIIPNGETVIGVGDIIYIIGEATEITSYLKKQELLSYRVKDAMIIGGSRIAYYLAKILEKSNINISIIENNQKRCLELDEMLSKALIINGDGSNENLLQAENINEMDAFISLTDRDEENLLLALYAVKQKVCKVIAKANRIKFDIIRDFGLDSIVSPKGLAANEIIKYVKALNNTAGNNIQTLYRLVDDQIEIVEFIVTKSAKCINISLKNIKLKNDILIAIIIRNGKIIIPTGEDTINVNDNIIIVTKLKNIQDLNDIMRVK